MVIRAVRVARETRRNEETDSSLSSDHSSAQLLFRREALINLGPCRFVDLLLCSSCVSLFPLSPFSLPDERSGTNERRQEFLDFGATQIPGGIWGENGRKRRNSRVMNEVGLEREQKKGEGTRCSCSKRKRTTCGIDL